VHDADEARRAGEAALEIFGNVNFDLMYALPRQSVAEAEADATEALAFAPPHLSFYHLTLEPNTLFHRYPPQLPDDDASADIEDAVHEKIVAAGYRHYETSAFARPGRECRHNLNYWRFGDYLGIGAGAHSKLSFADRIVRQVRHKQPKQYLAQVAAGATAAGRHSRHAQGRGIRVHAERVAADRWRAVVAVRRAHRVSAGARQ
jgi:oxygen-independent coproporphyrinogen-3 oxidase